MQDECFCRGVWKRPERTGGCSYSFLTQLYCPYLCHKNATTCFWTERGLPLAYISSYEAGKHSRPQTPVSRSSGVLPLQADRQRFVVDSPVHDTLIPTTMADASLQVCVRYYTRREDSPTQGRPIRSKTQCLPAPTTDNSWWTFSHAQPAHPAE